MMTIRRDAARGRAEKTTGTPPEAGTRNPRWAGITATLLLIAASAGCASNHAFVRGTEPDVADLVSKLEALEAQEDDGDVLYDGLYIPLAHLDLQLFAENDERHYPEGHLLLSMRSWLPLFGIVDGDFTLYDKDFSAYEKGEFSSVLWGLWSRKQRTVKTLHGDRVENNYGLLWILDLGPHARYPAHERK